MNPQWVSHHGAWCSETSGFLSKSATESARYIYHERQLGGLCGETLRLHSCYCGPCQNQPHVAPLALPNRRASLAAMSAGVHCLNNLLQATHGHARQFIDCIVRQWLPYSCAVLSFVFGFVRHESSMLFLAINAWWTDDMTVHTHFASSGRVRLLGPATWQRSEYTWISRTFDREVSRAGVFSASHPNTEQGEFVVAIQGPNPVLYPQFPCNELQQSINLATLIGMVFVCRQTDGLWTTFEPQAS